MRWVGVAALFASFALLPFVSLANEQRLMWSAKVDLNGDSKPETIRLTKLGENGSDFRLHTNQAVVEDNLGYEVKGFYIADVDESDKYCEVVVYTPGPSDDLEHLLFWFDGKRIHKMGRIMGGSEYLRNGIVLAYDWMGFWTITRKYALTKERKLVEVPQEFYYVGVTGKVSEPLTIYQTRKGKRVLATLRVGSEAEIILSDAKGWYLVKSENNLLGWAKEESIKKSMWASLPLAD
ncbi:MAG: hypothetical protein N2116_04330 [Armatimonadetes bacterium]|nr:hypothetical protein [Armatimonadota bacterium]